MSPATTPPTTNHVETLPMNLDLVGPCDTMSTPVIVDEPEVSQEEDEAEENMDEDQEEEEEEDDDGEEFDFQVIRLQF